MTSSVYLETTIPRCLTAWRSTELSVVAKHQFERQWRDERREDFDLFISDVALVEASGGDPDAARRRLEFLNGISVLSRRPQDDNVALSLIGRLALPHRAL